MVSYSGQQQAEMEEFNRQLKEGVAIAEHIQSGQPAAAIATMPQPAPEVAASRDSLASLLQPHPSYVSPQSPLQRGTPLSGILNPMDSQHLQLLRQQQLQQQLAQQFDQQSIQQTLWLQSMLNMAQQQHPQQQQQHVLSGHLMQTLLLGQQQSRQGLSVSQQEQQQQQQTALAHLLDSQQRIDFTHHNSHPRPQPTAAHEECKGGTTTTAAGDATEGGEQSQQPQRTTRNQ